MYFLVQIQSLQELYFGQQLTSSPQKQVFSSLCRIIKFTLSKHLGNFVVILELVKEKKEHPKTKQKTPAVDIHKHKDEKGPYIGEQCFDQIMPDCRVTTSNRKWHVIEQTISFPIRREKLLRFSYTCAVCLGP